jgi:outer membrane protein assembly factor BamD (BamD/ComL family)
VDIVHSSVPDDHAEALYNLVELWEKTNNPERARDARQELETTYPDSPWSKKLKPAKPS